MAYKLFIDTNIYLDLLLLRGNECDSIEAIFRYAEKGSIEIYTSASSLLNVMYVMNSYKLTGKEIMKQTLNILTYTKLVNPDNKVFEAALLPAFRDKEDAVQYHTALQVKGMNYFITSNVRDYKNASNSLQALTPKQFIYKYEG